MANNFKPWVDVPTAGQQVQSASVFADDAQRVDGFKAGDPASALRVNSGLRQANVVVAGLMQFCDEAKTLPNELSLLSTVTQVKNAIKASFNTLHDTTLTSAKDYADTNVSTVQNQVTENENDIATLVGRVNEHDDEITALSGGTSTLTLRVETLETEMNTVQADIANLDSGIVYDQVIRTQADFEALIASPTWLDAVSVAFVGQFTLSTANNSGVKIPATVKQIHGFNGAKITITNFLYDAITAKGGLWYDTAPTTQDYSIRDLEVSCTGAGTGSGSCFHSCNNLSNCTGTGTGAGTDTVTGSGSGFHRCNNLSNCTGTGTGTSFGFGYGFYYCNNLSNCTGTGIGIGTNKGFGFFNIEHAVNCKDGGSSTKMWGGTNKNISVETCRKTLVAADNTTLNA